MAVSNMGMFLITKRQWGRGDRFHLTPTAFPAMWNYVEEEMAGARSCAVEETASLPAAVIMTIFQRGPFALESVL